MCFGESPANGGVQIEAWERIRGFVCGGGAALSWRRGEVSINSLGEMASTSKDATSPAKKKKGVSVVYFVE